MKNGVAREAEDQEYGKLQNKNGSMIIKMRVEDTPTSPTFIGGLAEDFMAYNAIIFLP